MSKHKIFIGATKKVEYFPIRNSKAIVLDYQADNLENFIKISRINNKDLGIYSIDDEEEKKRQGLFVHAAGNLFIGTSYDSRISYWSFIIVVGINGG